MGPVNALGTQKCWRVAFALATEPGSAATPAQVAQVEAYRKRFVEWFGPATDGRGQVITSLAGPGCAAAPDAGAQPVPVDAGPVNPRPDAGASDAGLPVGDAGPLGGGDAGVTAPDSDAGCPPEVCAEPGEGTEPPAVDRLRPVGCGCSSAAVQAFGLLVSVFTLRRRRRGSAATGRTSSYGGSSHSP